jgi:hypothetical protein
MNHLVPDATTCIEPKDSYKTFVTVPSSKVSEPSHIRVKLLLLKFPTLSLKDITLPGTVVAEGSVIVPELVVVFIRANSVL